MTVCRTRQGEVRGRTSPDGVTSFLGIPYAAPPFGALRFRAPAPPEPWTGVRDATAHGPTAPHAPYAPPFDALIPDEVVPGEECLNLGVWTPAPEPGAGLPVLVWVHGGAFTNGSGSASAYDGSAFARDGVVCVTLNYRLGADGFLRLPGRPDNRGLLDQIAALRWVRDNIASFGGDPGRVTVFGESAGAMSIGALLTAGAARGLFHRAILQSGACHHFLRPPSAELVAARLAEKLGIEPTPEAFDGVPLDELLPAQAQLRAEVGADPDPARWGEAALNMMPFEPVLEDLALPGPDSGVDLLIGSNREEYRLFLVPTERLAVFPESSLRALTAAYGLDPAGALAVYRAARPGATPGELLDAVATDWFYRIPAVRLAESVPGSYLYEFAWRSPRFGGTLGACHALELPFVFDRLHDPSYAPLLGSDPPQALADAVHGAWVSFAKTGRPGWQAYDRTHRTTMTFTGDGSGPVEDPRARERLLWEGVR
ncbi:carboxylesterase/lipase family protein [Streptomyces sp. SP18ES09]|uniref:carboxylesterase/lipase family protein n=1 Tax=Streptomyces sp. SP18ES09 TaxID=3002532 RepID=UPI002E7A4BED|nr:carboxylesterase/lipase family protein [Streptomyces sp. SP18ES09]MEE1813666.1 carboxylesterase/lipase family protein [Streptomyces sp. SP18ES09]